MLLDSPIRVSKALLTAINRHTNGLKSRTEVVCFKFSFVHTKYLVVEDWPSNMSLRAGCFRCND